MWLGLSAGYFRFINPIRYYPGPRTKQPSESGLTAVIRYFSRENRFLLRSFKCHEKAKSAQARHEPKGTFLLVVDIPLTVSPAGDTNKKISNVETLRCGDMKSPADKAE
jgi:hypothetical protein